MPFGFARAVLEAVHFPVGERAAVVLREDGAPAGGAKNAYAVIATGETAIYANVLLKKGVVK